MRRSRVPGRSWAWSVTRSRPKIVRRLTRLLLSCQGESNAANQILFYADFELLEFTPGEDRDGHSFALSFDPAKEWPSRSSPGAKDPKSTRLNSSHTVISYAVFCLRTQVNSSKAL